MRPSRIEKFSKIFSRRKTQFQTFEDAIEGDADAPISLNKLTSQLALEKSLQLISKLRSQQVDVKSCLSENINNPETINFFAEPSPPLKSGERHSSFTKISSFSTTPSSFKSVRRNQRFAEGKPQVLRRSRLSLDEPNITFMINPNCFVQIMIDYIYEQLNIDKTGSTS